MIKNPFLQVDRTDYWMGMAFLFAARSPVFNAALLVDADNDLINATYEKKITKNTVDLTCDISVIVNCQKPLQCASLYMTSVPTEATAKVVLAKYGLRKVVYYPKKEPSDIVKSLMDGVYAELIPYDGNLSWLRDCARSLDYFCAGS